MSTFDLNSYLSDVYARFPEADDRPVIGITGNYEDLTCKLGQGYYKSVVAAGGVPMIIPPVADKDVIIRSLERVDALILSGGGDCNPLWAGEEPSPKLHGINQERDLPELLIIRLAYNRQIPMLGICRGIQMLAMALGGKVSQDISDEAGVKLLRELFPQVKLVRGGRAGFAVLPAAGIDGHIAQKPFDQIHMFHPSRTTDRVLIP